MSYYDHHRRMGECYRKPEGIGTCPPTAWNNAVSAVTDADVEQALACEAFQCAIFWRFSPGR